MHSIVRGSLSINEEGVRAAFALPERLAFFKDRSMLDNEFTLSAISEEGIT